MGYQRGPDREKDQRRRHVRDAARHGDGAPELGGKAFGEFERDKREQVRDRKLTRQLVEADKSDTTPSKAAFIQFLEEKRYGQWFSPPHFNAAFTALTPRNEDAIEQFYRRRDAAEKLAENLLRCPERPKPVENAAMLFCLSRLGVKNRECLDLCIQRAHEDLSSLDAMALNSVVYAVTRHHTRQAVHEQLLREVCSRMHDLLREDSSLTEKQKRDVAIDHIHHLGRYHAHSEKIFSTASKAITSELWDVNLRALGIFAAAATRVNWYSQDFLDCVERRVSSELQSRPSLFLWGKEAVGLSSLLRCLETFERPLDRDAITYLHSRIDAHFESYSPVSGFRLLTN
jgi:hypothetical protein